MKTMLTILCVLLLTTAAFAAKPVIEETNSPQARISCPTEIIVYDWNFNTGSHGFQPASCDDQGGASIWAHGPDSNFPGLNLWATGLNSNYPSNSGEALVSPSFTVDQSTSLVQLTHYYDTENAFDGMNLVIGDVVVSPMATYPEPAISSTTAYYAYCVDGQAGFTGHGLDDYVLITSCFDLADFIGQDVQLSFQFGSDSSISAPGWYLASVTVGGSDSVATDSVQWDSVKSMYR